MPPTVRDKLPATSKQHLGTALQVAAIALAAFVVYAPALRGGWIWDDHADILENPLLRDAGGLKKIWAEPTHLFDFYPIKYSVQWVQWQLWQEQPLGYHLTNLVLHIVGAALFWRLLRQLGLRYAWLGGLGFAVHPLAVESVAWCAELKNTLSLPPLLLACSAFVAFDANRRRTDFGGAVGWFLVAMLCKTSGVALPVVLLLFLWWKHGRVEWRAATATWPFFAISLLLGLVTIWFQVHRGIAEESFVIGGPLARLALASTTIAFYFWKCIWPVELLPIYPRWPVEPPSWPQLFLGLVIVAILALAWRRRITWGRHVLLAVGWFLLFLAPVAGFVPVSYMRFSWVMDHMTYLPILGLIGLAVAGLESLASRAAARGRWLIGAGVVTICVLLAVRARTQAELYRDEEKFWAFAAEQNPTAWMAHNNLGVVLHRRGRDTEAQSHYEAALLLHPSFAVAHCNYADLLRAQRRFTEAQMHYETALRLKPDYAEAHNNLGELFRVTGQPDAAAREYQRALQLDPELAEAHCNLGLLLREAGRLPEALAQYEAGLALRPNFPIAHSNYASALAQVGRTAEAIVQHQLAAQQKPDSPEIFFNLGNALRIAGRHAEAIAAYEQALRLKPDLGVAHQNLAISLVATGRMAEARTHYEQARRSDASLAPWPY